MKPRIFVVSREGCKWWQCSYGVVSGRGSSPREAYNRWVKIWLDKQILDSVNVQNRKRFSEYASFVMPSGGYNVSCVGGGGHPMDGATEVDKKSAWAALKGIFLL